VTGSFVQKNQVGLAEKISRTLPLCPVAVGLIAGVVFDQKIAPSGWVYVATFAVLAVLIALLSRVRSSPMSLLRLGALVLATSSVGGMWHLAFARVAPPNSIVHYAGTEERVARLRGTIVSEPRHLAPKEHAFSGWSYGRKRTVFDLEVESLEGVVGEIPVTGSVFVSTDELALDIREGERVSVFGMLRTLRPLSNPGAFDWAS
jgi:hypothetical protein